MIADACWHAIDGALVGGTIIAQSIDAVTVVSAWTATISGTGDADEMDEAEENCDELHCEGAIGGQRMCEGFVVER